MERIRIATPEEVQKIASVSDLTNASSVVALGRGASVDLAVVRNAVELDPVVFAPDCPNRRKDYFISCIFGALGISGLVPEVYFNIKVEDEEWAALAEKIGAVRVSPAPEFRYKMVLNGNEERTNNH